MIPMKYKQEKKYTCFLVCIKMAGENIKFFKNSDESYTMVNLYLDNNRFFGYKDSQNYYNIDVDKILLFKKADDEYIIRYNEVNKMKIIPLQLNINNFYGKLHKFKNNITLTSIESIGKKLFKKLEKYGIRLLN